MADMRVIVGGAAGRMGRMVVRTIHESDGFKLTGALERDDSPWLDQDPASLAGCPASTLKITVDPLPLLMSADAIIDFSSPAASVALAGLAAQARIVDVIGTTGLSDDDLDRIAAAARHAPIVRSGNMSVGVNLLAALTRRAASALGEDFDIEIVEMHHRMKVDAPSGTALLLGEAAAEGRGVPLKDHSARGRDGLTGARRAGDIGFASLRGGTVVGDHSVIFAGEGERVVLSHHAEDRALFARGALKAALWARDRKPGLYSMADVLGLEDSGVGRNGRG
jgi:4-hydroxy-tetrahydrodipicolinate reductase